MRTRHQDSRRGDHRGDHRPPPAPKSSPPSGGSLRQPRPCRCRCPRRKPLKYGSWSKAEDAALVAAVNAAPEATWTQHALAVPGRVAKQCRERWHQHLNPTVRKEVWSAGEVAVMEAAHAQYGNRWATIARMLPGRTDGQVKNYIVLRQDGQKCTNPADQPSVAVAVAVDEHGGTPLDSPRVKSKRPVLDLHLDADDGGTGETEESPLLTHESYRKRKAAKSEGVCFRAFLPDDELDSFLDTLMAPSSLDFDAVAVDPKVLLRKRRTTNRHKPVQRTQRSLMATEPPLSAFPGRAPATVAITTVSTPRQCPNEPSGRRVVLPGALLGLGHVECGAHLRRINAAIRERR